MRNHGVRFETFKYNSFLDLFVESPYYQDPRASNMTGFQKYDPKTRGFCKVEMN